MNIVLYDPEHFETLATLAGVFDDGQHSLFVLLPATMKENVEALGVSESATLRFEVLPAANNAHPKAVLAACKKHRAGLLVLGTVAFRHWQFAAICRKLAPNTRTILGVHDIHDLFEPEAGKSLRSLLQFWGKKRLRRSVWAFTVLLQEMKDYLLRHYAVDQPVFVIPGSTFNQTSEIQEPAGVLKIVVPGSINGKRRNLESVQRLLQHSNGSCSLTLAGPMQGEAPAWFSDYEQLHILTGNFVPVAAFENALQEAEIIWVPLPGSFQSHGKRPEEYGRTKSTGAFFDALRHGKPILLPHYILVPELLAAATITYQDEQHLAYLLDALAANAPARQRLQQVARAGAARVSLEGLRAKLLPSLTGGA